MYNHIQMFSTFFTAISKQIKKHLFTRQVSFFWNFIVVVICRSYAFSNSRSSAWQQMNTRRPKYYDLKL